MAKSGFSQDPAYYTIGETEFANTDIYTLLYDEVTDILYVGTNNGLYTYKQNKFIPVLGHKEQIGSSFFDLKQNAEGAIYCSNMSGQIFQIVNNKLELIYSPKDSNGQFNSFDIYKGTQLIVSFHNDLEVIKEDGTCDIIFDCKSPLIVNEDSISICNYGAFSHFESSSVIFGLRKSNNYLILLDSLGSINKTLEIPFSKNQFSQFVKQSGKIYGVKTDGKIEGVDCKLYQNFESHEKERIYTIDTNLVIGLNSQRGFRYIYLENDTLTCSSNVFEDLFISAYTRIGKNGMLLGTFGEGIRIVSNSQTTKSYHEELFLGITAASDDRVAICCRSGEVFELKNDKLELIDKVPHNVDNVYYAPNNQVAKMLGYGDFVYNDSRKNLNESLDLLVIDEQSIFLGTRNKVVALLSKPESIRGLAGVSSFISNRFVIAKSNRVSSLTWDPCDSTFYFSAGAGVFKTRWDETSEEEINIIESTQAINDLFLIDSLLLCSTQMDGLMIKNIRSGETMFTLNSQKGLKSNHAKQAQLKDNKLFIITKEGLQVYDMDEKKFIGIGISDGLEPEKVTKFSLSNNKLWMLEKHSFSSIDLDKIYNSKQQTVSKLYLDSILVNNQNIDYLKTSEFGYQENAFKFYFDYRDLLTKTETQIVYTLEGFYDDWKVVNTNQNSIEFQSLPVGKYVYKIKAKFRDSESKIFTYGFEILPPFWQRWWFYVLIGVFAASIIALIAVYRVRSIRRKNSEEALKKEMEKDAIDAQLKAIKTQMNPHFIFNSINSIQDLVLQKETLKSYDYLVVFSKMVRTILDFSEREFIPLEEELTFLNTYLGLEKLRFQDEFKYEVVTDTYSKTLQVPSLIIQPFAENAIKHGLLHKDGEKLLQIFVKEEGESIIFTVIDNGVGMVESQRIKERQSGSHKSFSTGAIEKRLLLLKGQTNSKVGYVIENLLNNEGESKGTKVIITLPVKR